MTTITSKVFAITGGASGMGLGIAKRLAQLNARAVCLGDINTAALESARATIQAESPNTKVHITRLDVSSSKTVSDWVFAIVQEFNALDGAVNCAGIPQNSLGRGKPGILDETDEEWDRIMAINANGVFYSTKYQVKAMMSLPRAPRSIVNISSMGALVDRSPAFAYVLSKKAVSNMTTMFANDLEDFEIRVNAILPGVTDTPMLSQFFESETSDQMLAYVKTRTVTPEDIARVCVWLLSDEALHVTATNVQVGRVFGNN